MRVEIMHLNNGIGSNTTILTEAYLKLLSLHIVTHLILS
jgi:hypothetical protein